jgi:hypothetical protein
MCQHQYHAVLGIVWCVFVVRYLCMCSIFYILYCGATTYDKYWGSVPGQSHIALGHWHRGLGGVFFRTCALYDRQYATVKTARFGLGLGGWVLRGTGSGLQTYSGYISGLDPRSAPL